MTQITRWASPKGRSPDPGTSRLQRLISESLSAQGALTNAAGVRRIPAVAESPIPVLARRNRTPDPLARHQKAQGKTAS